jgi:hypothetical protein
VLCVADGWAAGLCCPSLPAAAVNQSGEWRARQRGTPPPHTG